MIIALTFLFYEESEKLFQKIENRKLISQLCIFCSFSSTVKIRINKILTLSMHF